jgi:hypothetical protein
VPADKRLRDLVRLRLLTRRTQGNTKAVVVVAGRRVAPVVRLGKMEVLPLGGRGGKIPGPAQAGDRRQRTQIRVTFEGYSAIGSSGPFLGNRSESAQHYLEYPETRVAG